MKSLQDYIDTFRGVADKLNLQGDSVEVLVQMLANASYISEVENISYAQESSLEKATLINSKIQLCMDNMYSVFRGSCPRVILNIKPTKKVDFDMFEKIISGNKFDIYYLGYYKEGSDGEYSSGSKTFATLKDFIYAPFSAYPSTSDTEVYPIVGLLASKVVNKEWTLNANNTYYVDCIDAGLSNDLWVKIEDKYYEVTREFSEHIVEGYIYDLTLPSFGSRLFVSDIFRDSSGGITRDTSSTATPNTTINAQYFVFSTLSDYNMTDLKNQIKLKGVEMIGFNKEFLTKYGYDKENSTGVVLVPSAGRDDLGTIHYKASRDRYVNSIIRSNSDLGTVLEEMYPDKIKQGGTSYEFISGEDGSTRVNLYYVPINSSNPLTDTEIQNFISGRVAYYITDSISISRGTKYTVIFNLEVELYQNQKIDSEVDKILQDYVGKFYINFQDSMEEIRAQISKIDNVKQIRSLNLSYMREDGSILSDEDIESLDLRKSYFGVEYIINSVIQ